MDKRRKLGGDEEYREKGKLHFHYDREERLKSLSKEVRGREYEPRSIFKKNKSLIFILLDIIVIVMLFLGLSIFGGISSSRKIQDGFSFQLKAFEYQDQVFISLKIKARNDLSPEENNIISADFYCGKENSEERIEVIDLLPVKNGDERILRATLPSTALRKTAYAEIDFLGKTRTLKTAVETE